MIGMQRYTFALVVLCVLSLGFVFGAPPVFAQGFNFPSFNSTTNLALNGNAAQFGTGSSAVLRLTPNQQFQAGSAWFNTQQTVQQGFTTSFQFRISNPSSTPADGLAFVIQNSGAGTAALGPDGGGMGYGSNPDSVGVGIANSLAVEFDTFQNTHDPAVPHGAIQSCGTGANSSDETATYHVGESTVPCNFGTFVVPGTLTAFTGGSIHTVVINYDGPCSDCSEGTLTIFLDSTAAPVLTVSVDLANLLNLGEGGTAFVGFTSATGFYDEDNDILNWSFTPHSGQTTNAILTFNPGTNVSAVATFNCTGDPVCTGPEAHSLKLTASQVSTAFSLIVSATTFDGNGKCESGNPNDNTDGDCRFQKFFGSGTTVPLCDAYNNGHCVYYRIENPPDTSKYKGPIYWYIAWNDLAGLARCNADNIPTATYQCTNEQMADDPSDPPHPADANQFTRYITTYFNSNPNQVGLDPGLGGGTKNFNDVAAVFPLAVPNTKFVLFAPQPNTNVEKTDRLPIVFVLLQGSKLVTNALVSPNAVNVAVLDSNGVRRPIAAPGSPPPTFNLFFGFYFLFLDTSQLAPGSYQLQIDSNLFSPQTVPFTVVPED